MIAEQNFNNKEEENSNKEENKQPEFMAEIISEQDYNPESSEENLIYSREMKDGRSKAGLVAVILIIIIGGFWIWSNKEEVISPIAKVFNTKDKEQTEEVKKQSANQKSWQTANGAYSLEIEEQRAGDLMKIKSLTFAEDGWLVVYTNENDQPKNILSAYRFSKGSVEYWDMSLIKNLEANTKYHAVVFNEDGDRKFDYTKDQRVLDEDGQIMSVSFMTK